MLAQKELAFVKVRYSGRVAKVVGFAAEDVVLEEEMRFCWVLHLLFQERPEIPEAFPPGVLGFTVNGEPPEHETPVRSGDVITFMVPETAVQ